MVAVDLWGALSFRLCYSVGQERIVFTGMVLPWALKTYIWTGNPVYPFLSEWFGAWGWTEDAPEVPLAPGEGRQCCCISDIPGIAPNRPFIQYVVQCTALGTAVVCSVVSHGAADKRCFCRYVVNVSDDGPEPG